jgi:hypothetical protein
MALGQPTLMVAPQSLDLVRVTETTAHDCFDLSQINSRLICSGTILV